MPQSSLFQLPPHLPSTASESVPADTEAVTKGTGSPAGGGGGYKCPKSRDIVIGQSESDDNGDERYLRNDVRRMTLSAVSARYLGHHS